MKNLFIILVIVGVISCNTKSSKKLKESEVEEVFVELDTTTLETYFDDDSIGN